MKILGIGNAIVDVICKVEDDFISKNNLTKIYLSSIISAKIDSLSLQICILFPENIFIF